MDDYANALWETDGTTAGTKLVKSLGIDPGGFLISQLMSANGLLYFTFISYTTGAYELWRSDGTDAGTYHIGTNDFFYYSYPLQLTNYNNKLYFSADNDGTGSKLWITDGTDAGTTLAPGNNGIAITTNFSFGAAFPIIKNTLYISGYSLTSGSGLYKYDASNAKGVVLVKDITPGSEPAIIDEGQMRIVNNTLYFRVTNYNGGMHDELWRSDADKPSTQVVKKFQPTNSSTSYIMGMASCIM